MFFFMVIPFSPSIPLCFQTHCSCSYTALLYLHICTTKWFGVPTASLQLQIFKRGFRNSGLWKPLFEQCLIDTMTWNHLSLTVQLSPEAIR